MSAFATQDDDDEFTRRLKNTVEGAVMQQAVDIVGLGLGLFKGAAQRWIKANPKLPMLPTPLKLKQPSN